MRLILAGLIIIWAGAAFAHVGHVADAAGHGHWVGAAAIGLAVLVGLYGKLKDQDAPQDDAETDADDSVGDPEGAAA